MDKLTMKQWVEASIEQRKYWLDNDFQLTELSAQILHWAEIFRNVGSSISGEHMMLAWQRIIETEA